MDLTVNEISFALSMIDAHRWRNGGSKLSIALVVMVNTAGDPRTRGLLVKFGRRQVAEDTGMDGRWVRSMLAELVDEHVLEVTAEAAGSRGRCYALNPDVTAWRVPWRVASAELVEYRLAILAGRLQPANGHVVARYTAPQTRSSARYATQVNRACGAPYRATNGNGGGLHTAPQTLAASRALPLTDESDSSSCTDEEEEPRVSPSGLAERIAKLIRSRTSAPLFGSPLRELTSACRGVAEHQEGELESYVRHFAFNGGFMVLVEAACAKARDLSDGGTGEREISPALHPDEERTAELLAAERAERPQRPVEDFADVLRNRLRDGVAVGCDNGGGE